jgi:uncharacterized protein YecE (DUF72 family)
VSAGRRGVLRAGTSGFSYDGWVPAFYPASLRTADRLAYYAGKLAAVELNATFHRRPTARTIAGWVRATPPDFRFIVKAQRGAALRALLHSPEESVAWLLQDLDAFEGRLGAVLLKVPEGVRRDGPVMGGDPATGDARLRALLAAWPATGPRLVVELADDSWQVDESFASIREHGAVLCTTETAGSRATAAGGLVPVVAGAPVAPVIRVTGDALYLRLRDDPYDDRAVEAWARRLEPFLEAGLDVYAFFRHDETGMAARAAATLQDLVDG